MIFFNTNVFSQPGTRNRWEHWRNFLRQPGISQFDMRLFKNSNSMNALPPSSVGSV